jgi:acyl-CoA synthetase (NDP forming)
MLDAARSRGWLMEPEAKSLLSLAGISVPQFAWVRSLPEAARHAAAVGYPVAAKVVSPAILHKSDVGGVVAGIEDEVALGRVFHRFQEMEQFAGILVEPMVDGVELIVGAQIDYQFGPVVLLGIGGTGVEVYQDVAMRMAPLAEKDVTSMVSALKAGRLLKGYRGGEPISFEALVQLVTTFSALLMEIEDRIESIDLNPVKCSTQHCIAADARIMLKPEPSD